MGLLQAINYMEVAKWKVLPLLRTQTRGGMTTQSGVLADMVGLSRRQTYNYLRALEIAGLARCEGKRWKAA